MFPVFGGCDDERVTLGECRRATITAGVKYRGSSRGLGTSDNNSAARKPRVHTGPLSHRRMRERVTTAAT